MGRRRRRDDPERALDAVARRLAVFQAEFREDLRWWTREQPRIADRIWNLIEEIMRTPFSGTGKPEPLRYLGADVWSRRITQEHRLVYLVRHERIDFLQARYHYGDH
jgi:toxin YoeB